MDHSTRCFWWIVVFLLAMASQSCAWFKRQTRPHPDRAVGITGSGGASFGDSPSASVTPMFLVSATYRRSPWLFEIGMRNMFSSSVQIPGEDDRVGLLRRHGDVNVCRFWGVLFGCGGLSLGTVMAMYTGPSISDYAVGFDVLARVRGGLHVKVSSGVTHIGRRGSTFYFFLGGEGVIHLTQPQLLDGRGNVFWSQNWFSGTIIAGITIESSP